MGACVARIYFVKSAIVHLLIVCLDFNDIKPNICHPFSDWPCSMFVIYMFRNLRSFVLWKWTSKDKSIATSYLQDKENKWFTILTSDKNITVNLPINSKGKTIDKISKFYFNDMRSIECSSNLICYHVLDYLFRINFAFWNNIYLNIFCGPDNCRRHDAMDSLWINFVYVVQL